ncbi:MAG: pyrroline-5-carboxylate reductase [Candidatus Omnitrophota bacterium]|nr:pyrroline-5-carboxylate reductase [Candidatus Omnitrophota bacterium]
MFNFLRKKVGIIGCGNMGGAIAEGIKNKYAVCVFDKDKNKINALKNITVVSNPVELAKQCEIIILAVKPQDFDRLLNEIKDFVRHKLIISIAAGITTGYIEKILGQVKVIRVMPNIAVKIAKGETGICKGSYAKEEDLLLAEKIFNIVGKVWKLSEDDIDSVTAISGSGPAYIFYDMEIKNIDPLKVPIELEDEYIRKLTDAAIAVGFNPKIALDFAACTTASSISLLAQGGGSPAQLRKMITSPGGTTEAALKVITNGGSWSEAALAAKRRAQELSKKE